MNIRNRKFLVAGAVLGAFACSAAAVAANATGSWQPPRLADGHPDLQGTWTNATITPLERPDKYGNRLVLTAAEAQALEQAESDFNKKANAPTPVGTRAEDLPESCGRGFTGANCGYNNFWVDPGTKVMAIAGEKRSSMVVDPANGKLPPMTPQAQKHFMARIATFRKGGGGSADGPEARSLGERCILSFGSSAGPPMIPLLYNNNYQIVQTGDRLMILVEMVHDARIVRIGGRHRPANVRTWMGDSIGWWEGDTLVVETTNMRPEQAFRGSRSDQVKVTERFTRIGPKQILYRFTVDDPATFTAPWTGEIAMNATDQHIYEYACHEGNYALPGILAGARAEEKKAAAAAAAKGSK